jgi:hypothetical protein
MCRSLRQSVRFVPLALAFVVLGLTAACASAPKRVGPWCAVADQGWGNVTEDCSFATIAECRQVILGGNRGVCNRNPRWDAARDRRHPRH